MNIFQKIKLATTLNSDFNQMEQGVKMKNVTKIVGAVVAAVTAILQIPSVQLSVWAFLSAHPGVSSAFTGVAAIVALFHNPKAAQ